MFVRVLALVALLGAGLASAQQPPVRPLGSSPGSALPVDATILEKARYISGFVAVERAWDGRTCTPPTQWRLLRPRVIGKRVDDQDPIFQVEDEMSGWVGTWIGLLLQSGDPAGREAKGEPWFQSPVCVGVFDDVDAQGREAPNALATSDRNILMGWRMYQRLVQGGFQGNRAAGLVYVLAHEFGHYLQFRSRLSFSDPTAMVRELQSDCLAGYVMAITPVRPGDQPGFVGRTFELAAALGDQEVHDPDHHGTPEQRVVALRTGYQSAARALQAHQELRDGTRFHLRSGDALRACAAFPSDQQRAPVKQHLFPQRQ